MTTADDFLWAIALIQDKLHLCGCGSPETAYVLIRDLLRLMPLFEDERWRFAEGRIGDEGAFHLVLGAMTDADLITHGGTVGGSWIEPDGARLLAVLEAWGDDFTDFDHDTILERTQGEAS